MNDKQQNKLETTDSVSRQVDTQVIQLLKYSDWCKIEKLPRDIISKNLYDEWKEQRPKIQNIINNLCSGEFLKAKVELDEFIERLNIYKAV